MLPSRRGGVNPRFVLDSNRARRGGPAEADDPRATRGFAAARPAHGVARRCDVELVLTLGALLAEVPHTRPVRLAGGATDPELAARLGIRPTRYEGATGIVGVINTICRDHGLASASLWANVPHYISGIENPKATLALVKRVLPLLGVTLDLSDLDEAVRQFDRNLTEIVSQNAKIAAYVKKLESRDAEEPGGVEPGQGSDLPPAAELVAEIEQFLRQQRSE